MGFLLTVKKLYSNCLKMRQVDRLIVSDYIDCVGHAFVAQLAEQPAFNRKVGGSLPSGSIVKIVGPTS